MPKVFITPQIQETGPAKAQKIQDEIFRKMTPERRLRLAGEMYEFAKKIVVGQGEQIYERIRRTTDKSGRSA